MLAVVIVVLLAAGGGAVFALTRNDNNNGVSVPQASGIRVGFPQVLPVSQVVSFARAAAGPIYWAGPPGTDANLEVTDTTAGNVFIRYLTRGAAAGDPRPIFTTIGTYGLTHAYRVVSKDGGAKGAARVHLPGGGIAVTSSKAPDSVYVAFPHENYVAEVYATTPAHALRLALSGAIRPVSPTHR